jgi:4-amino-4-deoxy-L-arabinose transferase-like glycosyltransferase
MTTTKTEPLVPWVVALTIAGGALRGAALGHQSFWYDESVSADLSRAPLWDLVTGRVRDLGNPPLHPIVLRLWSRAFGDGDVALRSFSAVVGILTIPLLFVVARRIASPRVALVATAILAVSPVHVYFAQEARTYTLVTLLCLLSVEMLLRSLAAPGRALPLAGYAAATFLSVYAHYFAFFVVLAQVVYVLLERPADRRSLRGLVLALGAAALLYLTWLPALFAQMATKGNLGRSVETWPLHVLSTPLVFGVGTTLVWKDNVSAFGIACALCALAGFGVPAVVGAASLRRRPAASLVLGWLLLPILLPLLVSVLLFPFYHVRYGLPASPAYAILVAAGLLRLPAGPRFACVAGIAATCGLSLHRYYTTFVKHDFRDATTYVDARIRPDDVIAFDADIAETAYRRYESSGPRRVRLVPPEPGASPLHFYGASKAREPVRDMTGEILAGERVWLVLSDVDQGSRGHYQELLERDLHRISSTKFRGVEVSLYGRPGGDVVEARGSVEPGSPR